MRKHFTAEQHLASVTRRFPKFVELDPDDETGCHVFRGATDRDGYGQIKYQGTMQRAHRVAYRLAYGPDAIPEHHGVYHRCDNRRCVNPEHLWCGTHADNMSDMVQKGRANRKFTRNRALTPDHVREIRSLSITTSIRALARRYGVDPNTIRLLLRGVTHRRVV